MRRCLLSPIPEFHLAADLLDQAANALMAGDVLLCSEILTQADLRPLRDFAFKVCGPIDPSIHRQSSLPRLDRSRSPKSPTARMPSEKTQLAIMARDGYRCRFCGCRIVFKEAHGIFARYAPLQARLGRSNEARHFGLATLKGSIDHVVPFGRGGSNDVENLVTACTPCQFGRNQWTLAEVELQDPRDFAPVIDSWDGLTRLRPFK